MNKEHMNYIKEHCSDYIGEDDKEYLDTLLDEIDNLDDLSEYKHDYFEIFIHEKANGMCDTHNMDLWWWLDNDPEIDMYLKMALEECRIDISKYTLLKHIQAAQYCKYSRLFYLTLHYIEEGIRALGFRFEY